MSEDEQIFAAYEERDLKAPILRESCWKKASFNFLPEKSGPFVAQQEELATTRYFKLMWTFLKYFLSLYHSKLHNLGCK